MNFIFDQSSHLYTRNAVNLAWDGIDSSKFGQTKEFLSKPSKAGGAAGQLHLLNNDMPSAVTTMYHDSSGLSPSKGTASEVLNPGLFSYNFIYQMKLASPVCLHVRLMIPLNVFGYANRILYVSNGYGTF